MKRLIGVCCASQNVGRTEKGSRWGAILRFDDLELEHCTSSDLSRRVAGIQDLSVLALAILETTQEVAKEIQIYRVLAQPVLDAISARLLAFDGEAMADSMTALAGFLEEESHEKIHDGFLPELSALVALTHSALAMESIATRSPRASIYALRFFEAAVVVAEMVAPMGTHCRAALAARRRVLLRIGG